MFPLWAWLLNSASEVDFGVWPKKIFFSLLTCTRPGWSHTTHLVPSNTTPFVRHLSKPDNRENPHRATSRCNRTDRGPLPSAALWETDCYAGWNKHPDGWYYESIRWGVFTLRDDLKQRGFGYPKSTLFLFCRCSTHLAGVNNDSKCPLWKVKGLHYFPRI